MRFCILCDKAMFTSFESVWFGKKSYDCHAKCKEDYLKKEAKKNE